MKYHMKITYHSAYNIKHIQYKLKSITTDWINKVRKYVKDKIKSFHFCVPFTDPVSSVNMNF